MSRKEIWHETLHASFGQYFSIDQVLFHEKTAHQDLITSKMRRWAA